MAEREGFEPSVELPLHTRSRRARSTAPASLRAGRSYTKSISGQKLRSFALSKHRTCITFKSMTEHKIFTMSFATVYPYYVQKAEKKDHTKAEVDTIICWLTGYSQAQLEQQIQKEVDFRAFFDEAPQLNPNVDKITGVVCGHRVEEIEDPLMQKIKYLDKLIDELARGKKMESILRA